MELLLMLIGVIVLLGVAILYSSLTWGLLVWKFWYWFLLPVFPALPAITFLQAVGIMFFICLFKGVPAQVIKDEYVDKTNGTIASIIAPWLTLFIGWLVKIIIL
jgi:hypothetical protein